MAWWEHKVWRSCWRGWSPGAGVPGRCGHQSVPRAQVGASPAPRCGRAPHAPGFLTRIRHVGAVGLTRARVLGVGRRLTAQRSLEAKETLWPTALKMTGL